MSATVHRNFLFEPNAAVWDDTFAELASIKVNAVRTGLWAGWRKVSVEPGRARAPVVAAADALPVAAGRESLDSDPAQR